MLYVMYLSHLGSVALATWTKESSQLSDSSKVLVYMEGYGNSLSLSLSLFFFWVFACTLSMQNFPGPGIEPEPQQWQHQIL